MWRPLVVGEELNIQLIKGTGHSVTSSGVTDLHIYIHERTLAV